MRIKPLTPNQIDVNNTRDATTGKESHKGETIRK